jgi:hypothetical protein
MLLVLMINLAGLAVIYFSIMETRALSLDTDGALPVYGRKIRALDERVNALARQTGAIIRFPKNTQADFTPEHARDLLLIRQNIENLEPRVRDAKDNVERAILLRNHVYARVPFKMERRRDDFKSFFAEYRRSLYNPEHGHICGGLAQMYMLVCEAFGIPSRYAGLFAGTGEGDGSHASVEVFLKGKWVAMDPTFNVAFKEGNAYIGYERLRELFEAGKPCTFTSGGMEIFPDRAIQNYPVPLSEFTRHLVIYPATVRDPLAGTTQYPMVVLPKDWDGKLHLKDRVFDTTKVVPFYSILSKGILR